MPEGAQIVGAVPAITSQRLGIFWRHRIPSQALGLNTDNGRCEIVRSTSLVLQYGAV
jgi:hypothetical protein